MPDRHTNTAPEAWPDGPFPARLGEAIARRGLGLQRLSAHLEHRGIACSASTLSLWRSARTRPRRAEGRRAVRALEEILGTPVDYLVRAEHTPMVGSTEWWSIRSAPELVLENGQEYSAALESFGLPDSNDINRLAVLETVRVDADRRWAGSTSIYVVQARADGVDRMIHSCFSSVFSQDPRRLRIGEPRTGARLGRRHVSRETGWVVSEFLLDAPLQKGEITVVEAETIPVEGPETTSDGRMSHELRSANPVGSLTLVVDFDPSALPVSVEGETHNRCSDPQHASTDSGPAHLQGTRAVLTATDLYDGAGLCLRWSWGETR